MNISKVKKSPYNPRKMDAKAKKALANSMKEFNDISGITINERTGNVISGNHRWGLIQDEFGKDLSFEHIAHDRYLIVAGDKYTGFVARIVDWGIEKEKAANIAANSELLSGDFTSDLQEVLNDIGDFYSDDFLSDLRLAEMRIEPQDLDINVESNDLKREKTSKYEDDYELEDEEPTHSEVRSIISTMKITFPTEHKDDILKTIVDALADKEYYDQVNVTV